MKQVGIGTRILNFLVDTAVIFLIAYIIKKINGHYEELYQMYNQPFKYSFNFGYLFFVVLFVYYFVLELLFKVTLGKLVSYTKVVTIHNTKPNALQILIRSLVRLTIIDMFFFPFYEKTLHDVLSKTVVVEK